MAEINIVIAGEVARREIELEVGDQVRLIADAPDGASEGEVVALQDEDTHPGKLVALRLATPSPFAHECDGLVEPEEIRDDEGNVYQVNRFGWWTRPECLERL